VFFSAVAFASGSTTSAVYYEIVLIMITVVSMVFGSILISLNKIYVLFIMADSVTSEEHFTKASEMIPAIIKWTCRTAIIVFTGLGGIKGMIAPMSDSLKKNLLYKTLQMIPGIGNSVEMVSQTVIGAGTIIKNGIGTAAIVVLVIVCSIPLFKLIILTCLFKVTAAVIEPVSDKRIVKAVNGVSVAIGSLAVIVLVTVSLFILMAAIICISTNYNYLA
jgi:stage III sporulation protein AE